VSSKYEFIDGEKAYPIVKMCRWAEVSRAGFYEWRNRPTSATRERRAALAAQIRSIFEGSDQTYGYRRVHAQLVRDGIEAGPELVRSIMAAEKLVTCQPRPYKVTTMAAAGDDAPVDLCERDFAADAPGTKFVGDITYIATWAGWVYLATVIDCYSKMVVGYAMADHMRTTLVTDALDMARRNTPIEPNCIFHSDRGSQYTSTDLANYLKKHKMRGSMGRTGVCWDNAMAESFFASLKKELVHRTVYPTRRHAISSIAHWIEVRYNRQRLHSGIEYRTPFEAHNSYEAQHRAA
jgi:transposase InsO family protein